MASFCDPCGRMDKNSAALQFCIECQDNLCHECVAAHRGFKALMDHKLTNIEFVPNKVEVFSRMQCENHQDYHLEFFCTFHDCLCCHSCIADKHRQCEKVIPANEASKNVKSSAILMETMESLEQFKTTTEAVVKNREENAQKIESKASEIQQSVANRKVELMKQLDVMESSTIKTLSDIKERVKNELQSEKERALHNIEMIEELREQLTFIVNHGSDQQLFAFLKFIDITLSQKDLGNFIGGLKERKINCSYQNIFKSDSIAVIEEYEGECGIKIPTTKIGSAQNKVENRPAKLFKKGGTIKMKFENVTGILTYQDQVLLFDGTQLYTLNPDSKSCSKAMTFETGVWDAAYHTKTKTLAVTEKQGSVHIIKNFEVEQTIKVPGSDSYGVAWVDDKLYIGGKGEVYILNEDYKYEKTIPNLKPNIVYYIHRYGEKLYLTNYSSQVICIDLEGNLLFSKSSRCPNLNGSDGIASDPMGTIFVVGRSSNNLHKLGSDGKSSKIVLSKNDGLQDPVALAFSGDYQKLYISNKGGTEVLVFDVVY